jgi:phosphoribosylaminoimidazolecarboxamide formyltransferase/IMP cyclohydrolase
VPRALLSVHDKSGIAELAARLVVHGWSVVASGGTAAHLRDAGVEVTDTADITGYPPILGHRVVTLHPAVHGGILADTGDASHVADLAAHGIDTFDLVVVNLYPFGTAPGTEMIDIGGPALVRAAAKNHARVAVVVDPQDYDDLAEMVAGGGPGPRERRRLARKAFGVTSAYDASIAAWLDEEIAEPGRGSVPPFLTLVAERAEVLRYGENPHQSGARYRLPGVESWWDSAVQWQGRDLSYLNVLDTEAAWRLVNRLDGPAAVVVKHANPCGAAVAATVGEAYALAHGADPVSAFGGIVAVNGEVDEATARAIASVFTEVVVAPSFDAAALEMFGEREALRLLEARSPFGAMGIDVRSIDGGLLVQSVDEQDDPLDGFTVPTARTPDDAEWTSLLMAWQTVAATSSNAISIVADRVLVGNCGGQPNRVDAARIAVHRAGDRARGAVAASDAFLPFADTVRVLSAAGVTALIQPGGSVRDAESVAAADEAGMAMVFTGTRHFRH